MDTTGYVAELYLPRPGGRRLAELSRRARSAVEEMAREGTPIRFRGAVLLPDDETCFCLYEASSAEVVVEASRRAEIAVDRVVRAETESGIPTSRAKATKRSTGVAESSEYEERGGCNEADA